MAFWAQKFIKFNIHRIPLDDAKNCKNATIANIDLIAFIVAILVHNFNQVACLLFSAKKNSFFKSFDEQKVPKMDKNSRISYSKKSKTAQNQIVQKYPKKNRSKFGREKN